MKYIQIEVVGSSPSRKTVIAEVRNLHTGDLLGTIKWYAPWRQYCFFVEKTIWSRRCWNQVDNFIAELMEERQKRRGNND